MSVIVCVSDGRRVCMASDSQAIHGSLKIPGTGKIVRLPGGVLVGADGPNAIKTYLRYRYLWAGWKPDPNNGPDTLGRQAHDLGELLRADLKERSLLQKTNEYDAELPGQFFVARGGEYVIVDGGGSVVEVARPYWAIGSGAELALGACHALTSAWPASPASVALKHPSAPGGGAWRELERAEALAVAAVAAACEYNDGCGGPVCAEWTEAWTPSPPPTPAYS